MWERNQSLRPSKKPDERKRARFFYWGSGVPFAAASLLLAMELRWAGGCRMKYNLYGIYG